MGIDLWCRRAGLVGALLLAAGCSSSPPPSTKTSDGRIPASTTVSAPWQALLARLGPASTSALPGLNDDMAWKLKRFTTEELWTHLAASTVDKLGPQVTAATLGGVPVLRVRPKGWKPGKRLAVYVHGGGWSTLSAKSSLISSALFADRTGLEVVSIDYTVAPLGRWPAQLQQVEAVFKALEAQGVDPAQTVLYGDSAGGNIAAGTVLRMRDEGLPLPGALVLWSPCTDLGADGDSRLTLGAADPILSVPAIQSAALTYADASQAKQPTASPVYADFSKGFPPTLIQVGTREILLSDAVRLYQAMDQAGVKAKLDVYEGMPHVFQIFIVDSPESLAALRKVRRFIDESLGGAS